MYHISIYKIHYLYAIYVYIICKLPVVILMIILTNSRNRLPLSSVT